MLDVLAHRAAVMLLEEAMLGAALRTADQADRPLGRVDQHQRLDRGIIIGEVALGQPVAREDDPVGVADLDAEAVRRCGARPSSWRPWRASAAFPAPPPSAGLSSRSAMKLGWRRMPSEVNSVKATSPTSLGLIQCDPRRAARGTSSGGFVDLQRPHAVAQVVDHLRVEAGADLAGIGQLAALAHGRGGASGSPGACRSPASRR